MKLEKLSLINAEALSNEEMKNKIGGQMADKGTSTGLGSVVLGGDSYFYSSDISYANGGHHYFVDTMMPGI